MNVRLPQSALVHYGLSTLAVALALLITEIVELLHGRTPAYFVAVMAATWFFGRNPGLLALILSTVAAAYYTMEPYYSFDLAPTEAFQLGTFVVVALPMLLLVSALKERGESLQQSEARYRTLFEYAPEGIVIADENSFYLDANASICKMLGYTREEFIGLHASDILVSEEVPEIDEALGVIHSDQDYHHDLKFRRKDGSTFPGEVIATKMPDGNLLGVVRDLSERERADQRFKQIIEHAPYGKLLVGEKGEIELVNGEIERLFGYKRSELLGKRIEMLVPERYRHMHHDFREGYMTGPSPRAMGSGSELFGLRKDGTEFPVEIGLNPLKTDQGVVILGTVVDISKRKQAEVAANESEKRFRQIIEHAPYGKLLVGGKGEIELVNGEIERLFGYDRSELLGKRIEMLIPERYRNGHHAFHEGYMTGPSPRSMGSGQDLYGLRKDGTEFPVEIGLNPLNMAEGTMILATVVDMTARKQAEKLIIENEAQFKDLFDNAPVAYHELDVNGCYTRINRTEELMLGYSSDELKGRHVSDFIVEKVSRDSVKAKLAGKLENKAQERTFIRKDGTLIPVLIEDRLIFDANGVIRGLRTTLQDITDRKLAEEQLRNAQSRLGSALLAGSIGTWTWDIPNDILIADEFVANKFSLDPTAAAAGLPVAEYMKAVREEDKQPLSDQLTAAIESCGTYDVEYRVRKNDGELQWIQAKGRVEGDAEGNAINFHGAVIDIHERKRIDGRFRRLVDSNAQGVIFWNTSGDITEANDAFLDIVGYTREDLDAGLLDWAAMTPAEYAHLDVSSLEELAAKGISSLIEKEFIRKDGSRVPIMAGAALFEDNPDEGVCFVLDITDRYQMQQSLRKSEEQLRAVIENLTEGLIIAGSDGKLLHWNRVGLEMFGLNPDEFSLDLTEFGSIFQTTDLDGNLLDANDWPLSRVLGGERLRECEVIVNRLDIPWQRTVSCSGSMVTDADGDSLAFLAITDITQRNQTQQALLESEEHFRFLNDLVEATRTLADAEQIMEVMSRMLGEHLGTSRCAYADVDEDCEKFTVLHDYTDGCSSTAGHYDRISDFGSKATTALLSGQTLIANNVDEEMLPEDGADMFSAIGIKALITCPLVKEESLEPSCPFIRQRPETGRSPRSR